MRLMFCKIFRLSFLVVLTLQTAVMQAATIESAQTGNWNVAATWVGGAIPVAGDDVVIKAGHTVTLSDTRSCVTLTVESGATLTLTGALNNSGAFLNQGTVDWSGTLTGVGNLTNDGILNISGGSTHNTAANITNNAGGTINWNAGSLDASGGGQILTNHGIFNLIGNNPSNLTCSMPIVNAGTINKTTGSLIIVQTFDNQATGTVNVSAGATLSFGTYNLNQSGAFIVDGTLSLGSNLTQNQVFTINGTANVGNPLTFGAGGGFSGTGTVNITGSASTFNAGSTLTTRLNITGGTLNDNVGLTPGEVTFNGVLGVYSGMGSPTFANGFIWNAGSFSGSGTVTISGDMSVNNASGHSILGDKQLQLSGTGMVNNGAFLSFSGTAKFIVTSTGSVTFDGASNASAFGTATNLFEIQSGGALIKSGSGTYTLGLPFSENGGSITVDGGTLRFGPGTQSFTNGTAVLNASTSLIFNSSTATMTGTAVSGDGTLKLEVSTLNANAGTTITSKIFVQTGTLNDNVGLQPGEVTLGTVTSCIYGGTGSPTFANGFIWNIGDFAGSGIVTVSGSLTAASGLSPMRISNTKELHITGAATFTGTGFSMTDYAKFIVKSGGSAVFHVPGTNVTVGGGVNNLFEIQSGGTLTKTGTGNLVASTAFSNAGIVSIETGTLNLNSTFTNTGTIEGTGILDLGTTNTNTGTFAPGLSPGTLGVVGNYVNSTLDIEIEAGPPVAKDLLNVTGNITLNGSTLNVSEIQCLPNGSYDIISYTGTRTGTFTTVNAPAAYTVSYDDAAKKVRLDYLDGVPTIVCPDDVSVNTDAGVCTASGVALGTPTGTDNCAGVLYSNDSGTHPIGSSTVTWTATDVIGQTATCEQTVTVSDAEPPVISCPADQTITVNAVCSSPLGTWTPVSLSDNCTAPEAITVTQSPDASTTLFGPGDMETVTLTAADGNGNTNDCDFTVTLNITSLPPEICNGLDDDCDGLIDDADPGITGQPVWYADADEDGYGNAAVYQLACNQPAGYVSNDDDCDDGDAAINPAAAEICNGLDDDCDGLIDDADPGITGQPVWYADADEDGYGNAVVYQLACNQPPGYVSNDDDCNDANDEIRPAATEICNGVDDNCDGQIDETGGLNTFYADTDGDDYGDPNNTTQACTAPNGYVNNSNDCNDANDEIHPGATEICNGLDDDCDGQIDEGAPDSDGDGICNAIDNCPTTYNPDQADNEGDGIGDVCDNNDDNDPKLDHQDCEPFNPNVYPGAPEICGNLVDDDCDNKIDEQLGIQTLSEQDVLCNGDATGSITVTGTCGLPPYSYIWTNGATTATITGLVAGSYRVTVTDAQGLTKSKNHNITQPSVLNVNMTKDDVSCFGGSDGKATANQSGGKSPYTYTWSNGGITKTITGLASGAYFVTVTDNNGCTKTGGIEISQPTQLVITNIVVEPDPAHPGKFQITVTASGGTPYDNGYRYRRCNPGGTGCSGWQISNVLTNIPAGDYLVRVKDKNACEAEQLVTVGGSGRPGNNAWNFVENKVFEQEKNKTQGRVWLYPNPAETEIWALLPVANAEGEEGMIEVLDANGRSVLQIKVQALPGEPVQVNLADLTSGAYSLLWKTQGGVLATRFIVAKQ